MLLLGRQVVGQSIGRKFRLLQVDPAQIVRRLAGALSVQRPWAEAQRTDCPVHQEVVLGKIIQGTQFSVHVSQARQMASVQATPEAVGHLEEADLEARMAQPPGGVGARQAGAHYGHVQAGCGRETQSAGWRLVKAQHGEKNRDPANPIRDGPSF